MEQGELFARGVDAWTISVRYRWQQGYVVRRSYRLSGEDEFRWTDWDCVSAEGVLAAIRRATEELEDRLGLGEEPF